MDFGFYYRPDANQMLFHYVPDTGGAPCCYNTIVSESRIAAYIGIAKGEVPGAGPLRPLPRVPGRHLRLELDRDASRRLHAHLLRHLGLRRLAGLQRHAGHAELGRQHVRGADAGAVPARGALGPGELGRQPPAHRRAQIHHGLVEAGYGYWGFSPANIPEGGYATYGVDGIGSDPGGYPSNDDATLVDHGWPGCPDRPALPDPPASAYTNGVVTPHAAFLALRYAPRETMANLARLERDFDIYTRWGFRDSVNVDTGVVSDSYLSLDQGMIMAAIGNALGHDLLRRAFSTHDVERELRPVMGVEEFNASPRPCTITGTPGTDRLRGTRGDDVICGLGGDDTIDGRDGDDALFGDGGRDRIEGGDDDDTLYGGEGDDRLDGERGVDVLSGGPGFDVLRGEHREQG